MKCVDDFLPSAFTSRFVAHRNIVSTPLIHTTRANVKRRSLVQQPILSLPEKSFCYFHPQVSFRQHDNNATPTHTYKPLTSKGKDLFLQPSPVHSASTASPRRRRRRRVPSVNWLTHSHPCSGVQRDRILRQHQRQ